MPDIFGTPVGSMAANEEQQHNAMFGLQYHEEQNKVAISDIQLQQQTKMLQMLNQQAIGKPGQPSGDTAIGDSISEMYSMARMYEATGQLDKAGLLFSRASTMQRNQSEIESKRLTDSIKNFNTMSGLMEDVHDEASWKRANAMFELTTGNPSPYTNLPYNPQVVDKIRTGIETKKDAAMRRAADARAIDSKAAAAEHYARLPLIKAQTAATEARKDAIVKAGGKELLPNARDIALVTKELGALYGADSTDPETQLVAETVAERKKELQVREGLSPAEAAKRAVREAQQNGQLVGLNKNLGNVNRPMVLPGNPKELRVNKWYNTPKGKLLWNGKEFMTVDEVPGADIEQSLPPESNDEDDD